MYRLADVALLAKVTVCHHTEGNVSLAYLIHQLQATEVTPWVS